MKRFLTIYCLILITACESTFLPFESVKDKRGFLEVFKSKYSLTKKEYDLIKDKDSILYELSISIKDTDINQKLIRRRLDSFFLDAYTEEELKTSLELDRIFKGSNVEIERNIDPSKALIINSLKDLKTFKEHYDRAKRNIKIKMKKRSAKTDSLNQKKIKGN